LSFLVEHYELSRSQPPSHKCFAAEESQARLAFK
jgi:hypothetical protein